MSIIHEDPLFEIFEEHLHSGLYDDLTADDLIRDVVEFYWIALQRVGHVPFVLHDLLKVDLIQDVDEMLKARIYGHYSIGEYNRTRLKKTS